MEPDITQSAAQTPDGSNQPTNNQPTVPPGVQARFDEMTAQNHDLRRQMEAQNLATQELIASLAASNLRANQLPTNVNQPPPLPEGADPTLVNYLSQSMNQVMATQLSQFKQEIAHMVGGVRQSQEQMEFQQTASQYSPEVQKEAAQLLAYWKKNGMTGWRSEDAFIYAEGQAAKRARQNVSRTRPNGDGGDSTTLGGGSTPPPTTRQLPPVKTDAELAGMSLAQKEAYWASRVGNTELTY